MDHAMLPQLLVLALIPAGSGDPALGTLQGSWSNPSGSVVIAIDICGETLCGRVQWASDKALADARKGGTESLIGAELLSDIVPKGEGRWGTKLFVPDLNKRSKADIRQVGINQLKVTGCAVGRLMCKSQIWTRTGPQ
jgi:uncharacterized protein (DUF2147 family)